MTEIAAESDTALRRSGERTRLQVRQQYTTEIVRENKLILQSPHKKAPNKRCTWCKCRANSYFSTWCFDSHNGLPKKYTQRQKVTDMTSFRPVK